MSLQIPENDNLLMRQKIAEQLGYKQRKNNITKETLRSLHQALGGAGNAAKLKHALKHITYTNTSFSYESIKNSGFNGLIGHLRDNGIYVDELLKRESEVLDIPDQAREAIRANVEPQFNATVGILKGKDDKIMANPIVLETVQKHLGEYLADSDNAKNALNYHPGDGMPDFEAAMEILIKYEEEKYGWETPKGTPSKSFVIPGGGGGATLYRDFFLEQGTPVLASDIRWPNVDPIMSATTKKPITNVKMFDESENFDVNDIDLKLSNLQTEGAKKVGLYLNFPNNPTGSYLGQKDVDALNAVLAKYPDIEINILIDDPYGAYVLSKNKKVKTPLSYMIDTPEHVTIIDLGSHGTKEAGVYGLRISSARILAAGERIKQLQKKMSGAIRATFSMSSSIPQLIMIRAIFGDFNPSTLSEEEVHTGVEKYLNAREEVSTYVLEKIQAMKRAFENSGIKEIEPLIIDQEGVDGFFLSYKLTEEGKKKNINFEDLRKKCIKSIDNKISFAVFESNLSGEQIMRTTLISGDTDEYFARLKKNIAELTQTQES